MTILCTTQFDLKFHGRSWSSLIRPAQSLGGAMFSHHPAPSLALRLLTLGVLIVSGGTLAALPFRRYKAIPDASLAPAQATGPTQSALDALKPELIVEAATTKPNPVLALADDLPKWVPPAEPDRQIDMPLTYDDLAIPVDRPDLVESRFSATASVQQKANRHRENVALVMPAMESISIQQPPSSESLVSIRPTGDKGVLASTKSREMTSEPTTPRERHWIRQPK